MSLVIRESDVDLDVMRARCTPQELRGALESIWAAQAALSALSALSALAGQRGPTEPTHEVLRALSLAHYAVVDALDGD